MQDRSHWNFVHNEAEGAEWTPGLREIFEYRDLGIKDGTKGDVVAHVIRHNGKEQADEVQQWHIHECDFQLVYVLNGWATCEYEGEGERTIRKGDFEVLEIVTPADFATKVVDAPSAHAAE